MSYLRIQNHNLFTSNLMHCHCSRQLRSSMPTNTTSNGRETAPSGAAFGCGVDFESGPRAGQCLKRQCPRHNALLHNSTDALGQKRSNAGLEMQVQLQGALVQAQSQGCAQAAHATWMQQDGEASGRSVLHSRPRGLSLSPCPCRLAPHQLSRTMEP